MSPAMIHSNPSRIPRTSTPSRTPRIVADPMTLLMPGAGPPATRIASFLSWLIEPPVNRIPPLSYRPPCRTSARSSPRGQAGGNRVGPWAIFSAPEGRPMRPTACVLLLSAFVALVAVLPVTGAWGKPGRGEATRSVVYAKSGMVAAAQPLAVQAGLDILRKGGSAVDAAIAANACLGLMEPTANGLGGDLFAILWDPAGKEVVGLNASGRSPRMLTADKVPANPDGTIPLHSPWSWSVPGAADGWFELHAKYGKLPMKEVLAAAIHYAEAGFP